MALATAVTEVWPLASVWAVVADSAAVAPEPGAAKVTTTSATGLLLASVTLTTSGLANCTPLPALCGVPEITVTFLGIPGVLVSVNITGADPVAEACTVNDPVPVLAVKVGLVARPSTSVTAVGAPGVAPAPPAACTVNVTVAPTTGASLLSRICTTSGEGKAVLMAVDCASPLTAVKMLAPMLLRVKTAGATTPPTVALTL